MSEKVRRLFHRQGLTNIYKCYKNHITVGANTTLEHLQAVTEICWNIKKKGQDFITEAVPNNDKSRRIDIVNLTTKEEIEVEHTGKFKEGSKNYKVLTQAQYEKLKHGKNKIKKKAHK